MKVQATVLLLCFLCGVFLSYVVHAKPSPALMKELIALEKYLEKKQGSDGGDGQDKNQNEKQIGDNKLGSLEQNNEQIQTTDKGQNKPVNENNNNGEANNDGQDAPHENQEPDKAVPPEKPESVTPKNPEEGVTSENKEVVLTSSGGVKDGVKPQEGNGPNQSEGQEETGREQAAAFLNHEISVLKTVAKKLEDLDGKYKAEFEKDDRTLDELKAKYQQLKDKVQDKYGQVKIVLEQFKDAGQSNSDEKESVKENAPARRSHLSDTEFLNIVHSLLTNN